jgi:hypothetical protein
MSDKREDVLNSEYSKWVAEKGIGSIYPPNFPAAYKDAAINAMDENGKRMCLDLLEYMSRNFIKCVRSGAEDKCDFLYNRKWITKEQLFENFL